MSNFAAAPIAVLPGLAHPALPLADAIRTVLAGLTRRRPARPTPAGLSPHLLRDLGLSDLGR